MATALMLLFGDTSYWVALLSPRDEHHRRGVELSKSNDESRIVTSEFVLAELLDYFCDEGPFWRSQAEGLVRQIQLSKVRVVPFAETGFGAVLELYSQRRDKSWSFTDCASILVMQSLRIGEVLSTDRHFEQAGFKILLPRRNRRS